MGHLANLHALIEKQMLDGVITEKNYNEAMDSLRIVWNACSIDREPREFPPVKVWKQHFLSEVIKRIHVNHGHAVCRQMEKENDAHELAMIEDRVKLWAFDAARCAARAAVKPPGNNLTPL